MDISMTTMQVIKLTVDIAILLSLCCLCALFFRSRGGAADTRKGDALLESLKQMIREAERASSDLSSELNRQQRSLRQTLLELDSAEDRVRGLVRETESVALRSPRAEESVIKTDRAPIELKEPVVKGAAREHAADSDYSQKSAKSEPQKNIYGEIIESSPAPGFRQSTAPGEPAAAPATKIVRRPQTSKPLHKSLEEIYSAAEEMLKAGGSIKFVANYTNLPVDEVKKLSAMVTAGKNAGLEEQIEVVSTPSPKRNGVSDPRLGVLGMGQLGERLKRVEV